MRKIKKKWIILISILILLIGVRLALPYIILNYANKVLNEMEGYRGNIEDVDLNIYRGAYEVQGVVIKKMNAKIPTPFIDIEKIDLAVEWPAILKGKIVGEVGLKNAKFNFVGGSSEQNSQAGGNNDWTKPIRKLMPLKINKFEVDNGKVSYLDFTSKPKVNLYIENLKLTATNLTNASDSSAKLPSKLNVMGKSIGGGNLDIKAKVNILKELPDFDANIKFTSVKLTSVNNFAKAYGKFDFEKGSMSLFSEMAMANGNLDGYIKPILTDVQILNLKKDKEENLFQKVWEGLLNATEKVLENHRKEQFATRTPIHGNIKNIKTAIVPTILNILKNAFIEAFSKNVDEDIDFGDAQKKDEKSEKKKDRKEKKKDKKDKDDKK